MSWVYSRYGTFSKAKKKIQRSQPFLFSCLSIKILCSLIRLKFIIEHYPKKWSNTGDLVEFFPIIECPEDQGLSVEILQLSGIEVGNYSFLMWHRDTVSILEVNFGFTVISIRGASYFLQQCALTMDAHDGGDD